MDFQLTEEQCALREMCAKFTKKEIIPVAAEYDREAKFPYDIAKKAKQAGLLHLEIPEEFGGSGLGPLDVAIVVEELGYGCAGISQFVTANSGASVPMLIAGTHEQKEKHWRELCAGDEPKFAAFCMTEPEAGSDLAGLRTKAVRRGDKYILNGLKHFITNGGVASLYIVFATTDRSKGYKGISAFIVPRDAGVKIGKKEDKMGQRAGSVTEVIFEDVEVPAEDRIGEEGQGFYIMMKTLDAGRSLASSLAIGVARRAFDEARRYTKERIQFGKPIAANQYIQFKFADMYTDISAGRLLNWYACWLFSQGKPNRKEASIAKAFCTDAAMRITTEALQMFGGYGYMKEYPMEKLMRDAKLFQIYEGTNEIQRVIAAREILGKIT
ncbi:acyl-CoA dehydrogenase [Methanosarcinales archaeon]|nr:MAG: acyl-CoA dehydrogenase [Methanosarcinales archaeon]